MMIVLAEDEYPVEECLEVRVGKTPYLQFDKSDYSVPHTHVQRNLSVTASNERVRVVDPEVPGVVIADRPRTSDRDQRVEQEGHVRALVEEKPVIAPPHHPDALRGDRRHQGGKSSPTSPALATR